MENGKLQEIHTANDRVNRLDFKIRFKIDLKPYDVLLYQQTRRYRDKLQKYRGRRVIIV